MVLVNRLGKNLCIIVHTFIKNSSVKNFHNKSSRETDTNYDELNEMLFQDRNNLRNLNPIIQYIFTHPPNTQLEDFFQEILYMKQSSERFENIEFLNYKELKSKKVEDEPSASIEMCDKRTTSFQVPEENNNIEEKLKEIKDRKQKEKEVPPICKS